MLNSQILVLYVILSMKVVIDDFDGIFWHFETNKFVDLLNKFYYGLVHHGLNVIDTSKKWMPSQKKK